MPDRGSTGRVLYPYGPATRCNVVLAQSPVHADASAEDAVLSAIRGASARIAASDLDARHGDPTGIHRLRTSTRRLRSELRACLGLVDPRWRDQIDGELKWLAGLLGGVRDLDVQHARLRKAASKLSVPEERALRPLFRSVRARHETAAADLRNALASTRYLELRDTLERAIRQPMLMSHANERCDLALPPLAIASWRRLKKGARALKADSPDQQFHDVRKIAKRARYTAEWIAPILSQSDEPTADRFIQLTTDVQDALGEHQDATVAIELIERSIAKHADSPGFVTAAKRLIESQRTAGKIALTRFFKTWDKLDRKRWRRWMKCHLKAVA